MILITGGNGYIGSHTCVELLNSGEDILIIDNLENSESDVVSRIFEITKREPRFLIGDIRDLDVLMKIFLEYPIDAVIHFAGLKSVAESVIDPLRYYENNVSGTINLLKVMALNKTKTLVFSSSATVYGEPDRLPLIEESNVSPVNPYGQTKLMVEKILHDLASSDPQWRIAILRYFNPVGAHQSGLIGESPNGVPNNLLPYICRVAKTDSSKLNIFGNDYPTKDGTGVRDYIHVVDLSLAHLKALSYIKNNPGCEIFNLGTGGGYSVLEVLKAFEAVSGCKIPYEFKPRRQGDVAACFADPSKAKHLLEWSSNYDLLSMCEDSWRWAKTRP